MATSTTSLSNDEYRQVKAYSKSDLDNVDKSIALLDWNKNVNREKSEVADIGNATHAALLEPDVFEKEYIKMPDFDLRTNSGKASKETFEASIGDSKTTLAHDDYELVICMRDSALAHPVINKLLTSPGESEVSIFFEIDGIKCKCRPDRIVDPKVFGVHIIVDVKTCADVSKFNFSARDYRYDVQDAFYSRGYEELTGFKPRFLFAVIGKNKVFGSHQARLFELDPEDKANGEAEYMKNLKAVKEFEEFGGGGLEVEQIKLPKRWN